MRPTRGLFASVIGRRLLALFVLAAFVPIAAMLALALTRVNAAVEAAFEEKLAHEAKGYGMLLLDHLARLQYLLDDAVNGGALQSEVQDGMPERLNEFDSVTVLVGGRIERGFGSMPAGLRPEQFDSAFAHGKTVLTRQDSAPTKLIMFRRVVGRDGVRRTVVAAPKMARLWKARTASPR